MVGPVLKWQCHIRGGSRRGGGGLDPGPPLLGDPLFWGTPSFGGPPLLGDPLFWGTPKLHKEGKNVVRVPAKTSHFST